MKEGMTVFILDCIFAAIAGAIFAAAAYLAMEMLP